MKVVLKPYAIRSLVLFLSCAVSAHASFLGNPASPAILEQGFFISDTNWSNIQLGFAEDALFQKKFFARQSSKDLRLRRASIQGMSRAGCLAWGIAERFNLQCELGSGQFFWRWKQDVNTAISGKVAEGLIWSGDAKLVVFEIQDTLLAVDVHAGGWDWMRGFAQSNGVPLPGTVASEMRYWQVGAALAQKIVRLFVPYFGVAVNRSRLKMRKLESGVGWLRSSHSIGPFVGCTVTEGTLFFLNLEWRGGFEQGFSVSGQVRF